jgi:hypothetical protein
MSMIANFSGSYRERGDNQGSSKCGGEKRPLGYEGYILSTESPQPEELQQQAYSTDKKNALGFQVSKNLY